MVGISPGKKVSPDFYRRMRALRFNTFTDKNGRKWKRIKGTNNFTLQPLKPGMMTTGLVKSLNELIKLNPIPASKEKIIPLPAIKPSTIKPTIKPSTIKPTIKPTKATVGTSSQPFILFGLGAILLLIAIKNK